MGVTLVYEIVGNKPAETSTTSVHLFDGSLLESLTGFAVAFATILNNVITGKILSAALVFDIDISGVSGNVAEVYSDVEEVAGFFFETESQGNPVYLGIPSLIETVVLDETHDLDQVATNVAAVIAMMEDGIAVTGGTIRPSDIGEDLIDEVVYAREQAKNSGARKKL